MNKPSLTIVVAVMMLLGCSGDDAATSSNAETETKHDALTGYKHSLDTAKSVTSMAEESEQKKNQAIQDLQ